MTIMICEKCNNPVIHPNLQGLVHFSENFCLCQPESSKREDHVLVYKDPETGIKTPIRDLFNKDYGCGTPNSMET